MSLPSGDACSTCPLGTRGEGFQIADGLMETGVMLVAEALGEHEAKQGKGLVGPSGFFLGRIMRRLGLRRDAFRYENALHCRPNQSNKIRDGRGHLFDWAAQALAHCPYMDREIDAVKPRAIVALGETAFHKLTGETLPIMAARGYVFPERSGRGWVIPTFHPAYLLRGQQGLAMVLQWDLEKAIAIARDGFTYEEPRLLCDPSLPEWERWVDQALRTDGPLAYDIETPYTPTEDEDELAAAGVEAAYDETWTIERVSFAVSGDEAVSVPWALPYLVGIKELFAGWVAAGKTAIAWNVPFDRPRVQQALGLHIPRARSRDTMDAFHVLYNSLPRKLGFATACLPSSRRLKAWKHLSGLFPAYYSAMDALVLWRNDQDILRLLAETGQLEVYRRTMGDLDPILERMSLNGMRVDPDAKRALQGELDGLMAALTADMQRIVPAAVKNEQRWQTLKAAEKGLPLLVARGEVAADEPLRALPAEKVVTACGACGAAPVTKVHVTRKSLPAEVDSATPVV